MVSCLQRHPFLLNGKLEILMYLTFDVGTTSVKTALYDMNGKLLYKVINDYTLSSSQSGWYEVQPEVYWDAVVDGFREIAEKSGISIREVKSISGCSQGETVVFLDGSGRAMRPALVWYDSRARDEISELEEIIGGSDELYRVTGIQGFDPMWSAPKILWVKKNQKKVFQNLGHIMLVEDYIVYRLTGMPQSSASLLSTSMLVDIHGKQYWDRVVDFLGIRKYLPPIVEEGSVVGKLVPRIADDIGLGRDVIVVKGSMDQNTGAVGAGNIKRGVITETTGSALAIGISVEEKDTVKNIGLPCQPHAIPGLYIYMPFAQTAGAVYKWFRDAFGQAEIQSTGSPEKAFEALNQLAGSVEPGADGLVFLPFLAGASFPENDSFARGAFYGIALRHNKGHFARSILEAVGYMLRKILVIIENAGIEVTEVHSMGGGARSDLWLQIKADICGYPFVKMVEEETATLGAAILASVRTGDYASYEESAGVMVKTGRWFMPDKSHAVIYKRGFSLYNELYEHLKPLFRKYSV